MEAFEHELQDKQNYFAGFGYFDFAKYIVITAVIIQIPTRQY